MELILYEHVRSLDLSELGEADLLAQPSRPIDMKALVAAAATPEVRLAMLRHGPRQ